MLKAALMFGSLTVVFALARLAFRRSPGPDRPETDDDAYMRNIRAITGDFGTKPLPENDIDPMRAPIFPPPQIRER